MPEYSDYSFFGKVPKGDILAREMQTVKALELENVSDKQKRSDAEYREITSKKIESEEIKAYNASVKLPISQKTDAQLELEAKIESKQRFDQLVNDNKITTFTDRDKLEKNYAKILFNEKEEYRKTALTSKNQKTLDSIDKSKFNTDFIQPNITYTVRDENGKFQQKNIDTKGITNYFVNSFFKNDSNDKNFSKNPKSTVTGGKKSNNTENLIVPEMDIPKLISTKTPFFRKSYSAFDVLVPYIKCYILTPQLMLENKSSSGFEKNFFDIPYNMIKSLELEFDASPGVAGKFTLKLEDATGAIGDILVAQLFSLGLLKNPDGVPKINIEFGWGINGLKKISKKYKIFYKNFFPEFQIHDVDIEFSEKFKQEMTLKGYQDKVGITQLNSFYMNSKSEYTPYAIIGNNPVENIRFLQYYHYFDSKKNTPTLGMEIFSGLKGTILIKQFINKKNKEDLVTGIIKNRNFIASVCGKQNDMFNHIVTTSKEHNSLKDALKPFLSRSYFHSYLVFCYVLNQYINEINKFYSSNERGKPDILFFCYYSEQNIDGFSYNPELSFKDYCINDVTLGVKKQKHTSNINDNFSINDSESWEDVLSRLSKLVRFTNSKEKNSKLEANLYFEINRYVNSDNSTDVLFEENDKFSDIKLNNLDVQALIDKFKKLDQFYIKDQNSSTQIKKILEKLEEKKKSKQEFIYIILTSGSPFLTDQNYVQKPILQSYTVFPKNYSDDRLDFQNFNAGSKSLYDESYPDVISFRPKINYKNLINANLATNHNINFFNGVISYKHSDFDVLIKINSVNESKALIEKIENLKSKTLMFDSSDKNKTVKITLNAGAFYINDDKTLPFISTDLRFLFPNGADEKIFKIGGDTANTEEVKIISIVRSHFQQYLLILQRGYHFSTLNSLLKKSKRIFPGDNNLSDFYSYINSANEYRKLLSSMAGSFEAELKILGEPAFTYDFGPLSYVLMKVNNFDGSPNVLLSGIYSLSKIKHTIESSKFETTLTLRYDSPWNT
jgi:hypothetical protein